MKIALIHYALCDNNSSDIVTAAVCFLATQLAKLGAEVTIFSQSENAVRDGVRMRKITIEDRSLRIDPALLESDFKALIFFNVAIEFVTSIKGSLPYKPKVYLWTNLEPLSPINAKFGSPDLFKQLDKLVCVSDWQRVLLYDTYDLPKDKLMTIPYAISPLFENQFSDGKAFVTAKSTTPRIAYMAESDDGLDIMIDSLFDITDNYKEVVLGIFSPIKNPTLKAELEKNKNIKIYDIKNTPELVTKLRNYTIFVNPSIQQKTYNITLTECMAEGMYVISTDVAGNNDYCFNHGKLVTIDNLRANSLDNFLSIVLSVCQSQTHYASEFYDVCFKQVLDINKKHTWAARAQQWLDLINTQLSL